MYKPHDYQQKVVDFVISHPISAVFLDMGLGKTFITLMVLYELILNQFVVSRVLIVAPLRVAKNTWKNELTKFGLDILACSEIIGSKKQRLKAVNKKAFIYIINRDNLTWLAEQDVAFDMIILDEAQSFKNISAQRTKAVIKLRKNASRVVLLTGTPSPNTYIDLYAQFKILDGGQRLCGTLRDFTDKYFIPESYHGKYVVKYALKPNAANEILTAIDDITICMKSNNRISMPILDERFHYISLSPSEQKLYDQMKDELYINIDGKDVIADNIVVLIGKLTQFSSGSLYDEDHHVHHIHDRKLDSLENIIKTTTSPILIAYNYKHELERLKQRFGVREIKSSKDITEWNTGKIKLAAINPQSCACGLNLQEGGHILVWFTLTYNMEQFSQTNARIYRQGQPSSSVIVYYLIARNTIDENIMNALRHKGNAQEYLFRTLEVKK
ncbi:MAG: SNF2-related protein [Clostridia bacterium]